ncbi:pyridoxamine 5'-phosphate oxidase family protein [Halobaculum sp. WSA2]|uniref:Pyridoxamine 5'-phosphate oxidase family protein n=1 Tax=Halobaculum saliterrae TaxID=2073113 RepID=A0A6B0SNU2_9EURY|nr:pyridoxamine 5'-phosphate oxidase family protein [Halobaculum saliterrae]MXR40574.1 pyridoxamine 5'-phosphate oxidase family protein [Halobaculum saliterrae]
MGAPDTVTMADDERDVFLGTGGVGVMSLASESGADEPPHSVPVSYGYDGREETFYFRLAVGADSGKPPLTDRAVTFVTYDTVDGMWHSVVASGRLESTTDADISTESLAGLDRVGIPLVDAFGRPTADVQFEFYRLVPDSLTGRKESSPEL